MSTMEDLDPSILYCLFKGEPGTRKSTAALSFPRPQYWFSVDKKMDALSLPMKKWGVSPKDIHYDDYAEYNSIRIKMEKFAEVCNFKTIILDSITSIGDATNRQTITSRAGQTNKQGEEKGMRIGGIPVGGLEDYKAENAAFGEIIALTKEIKKYHGVHIILIGHVIGERKENERGITHHARTLITGGKAISGKIAAYSSEIYHFNASPGAGEGMEGEYTLLTTHTGDDFARTSLPLDMKITFNDKPLFDNWLKPAIEKLKEK
jgi:hypothetical protein